MKVSTSWCRVAKFTDIDKAITLHHHSFFELHFCLSGEARICLNEEQEVSLIPGTFVLLPKNLNHKISCLKDFAEFVCGFQIELNEQHNDYIFLSNALYRSKDVYKRQSLGFGNRGRCSGWGSSSGARNRIHL